MKKNIAMSVLLVVLGAGGAYLYITFTRTIPKGEKTVCEKHRIAESECPFCDKSLIEKMGQCVEHDVPGALCYKCNPALIPAFKAEGDWCAGHNIPESQCTICNPGLLGQGSDKETSSLAASMQLIHTSELPRNRRFPSVTCQTEALRVQFRSPEIARRAGLGYTRVERKEVTQTLSCNAEIAYDSSRYAHLSSRAPGVVQEVKKDLGQPLAVGEILAVIDSMDLGTAKAEYLELRSEMESASLLVERNRQWFQRVSRMEVRLTANKYIEAKKLLEIARKNFNREKSLMDMQLTSERELLEARSEMVRAQSSEKSLRQDLLLFGIEASVIDKLDEGDVALIEKDGTTSEQPVIDAQRILSSLQVQQKSARNKLLALGLTEEEIEHVNQRHDTSGLLPLRAPFQGVVVERSVVMGEVVDTAKSLFAIADTSQMWAIFDVYESDIPNISIGQSVVLEVEGPRGKQYGGRVTWVSSHVDSRTRTLKVRAEIANLDGFLRAGMFGKVVVSIRDRKPVLIVPKEAIQWEGCCNIVFVRQSDVLFEPRKVHLGYETERFFVVEKGVKEGEEIVTSGSFLLKTEILKGSIGAGCCEIEPGK